MTLTFSLYPFQQEELDRLWKQKARLIGWEMGLGKTYMGLALDLTNRQQAFQHGDKSAKKTLIVCPQSVFSVWEDHCKRLAPHLDVTIINPKNRKPFEDALSDGWKGGYFICHWESLRLLSVLKKVQFFHVIADEVHRAKNRKTQQTLALKRIKTTYKTAMSGTPADNKPQDLWSILNWLWPSFYTSYWRFFNAYVDWEMDYNNNSGTGYRKMIGVKHADNLQKEMRPWYTRRLKKDVLQDLPDKYYSTLWVDLASPQRKAYDQMRKTMVAWIEEQGEENIEHDPIIAQAVVSQLVRLQQFSVGYMKQDGTKWVRNKKTGEKEERPNYVLCEPSTKLDALMEVLHDNEEEQIVVFSQFKSILALLERRLRQSDISYGLFTGDVAERDRARVVEAFQRGLLRVFLGTIAAGGVGITLTASSTVVFLDRAWSPAYNVQAEDRLHRIGQTEAVQVIDIMARNTVDWGRKQQIDLKMSWLRQILGDK